MAHGFRHEATQRRDALFDGGPASKVRRMLRRQAQRQFVPEAVIGPLLHLVREGALHVIAATRGGTHAAERKAALMIGVDQLVRQRWHIRQNAQPTERIYALEGTQHFRRHGLARNAVVPIAASDEIAVDALRAATMIERDVGCAGSDVVQGHLRRLVTHVAAFRVPGGAKVALHFRLPVDGDRLSGQAP